MNSVEHAYQVIADVLVQAASHEESWEFLYMKAPVLGMNMGGTTTLQRLTSGNEIDIPIGMSIFKIQKAVLFLRDDLLRTTGQRIWGLTFTLYPDGKFNIEYDYNKPEGYEETDEVITGDEINASLADLMKQGKRAD